MDMLASLETAHAQLHLSRVGRYVFISSKIWPREIRHNNTNFNKRKTNQKECPD